MTSSGWSCANLFQNLVLIFQCAPVEAQWDITIQNATCISRRKAYVAPSAVNVVTDVVLLILPIPYVWNLHASLAHRMILIGIFLLGTFVGVVSVVRLIIFIGLDLTSPDVTYNLSEVAIWSGVEINVSLICACLPSLRPAVQWLGLSKLFMSTRISHPSRPSGHIAPSPSLSGDRDRTRPSKKKGGRFSTLGGATQLDDEEDTFQMIGQHNDLHGKTDTNIDAVRTSWDIERDFYREGMASASAIKVQRQWDIRVDSRPVGGP